MWVYCIILSVNWKSGRPGSTWWSEDIRRVLQSGTQGWSEKKYEGEADSVVENNQRIMLLVWVENSTSWY